MAQETLVTVDGFPVAAEAEIAKAQLEDAGIPAFLADAHTAEVWVGAIGQVRIQVPRAQVERAREILREYRRSKAGGAGLRFLRETCLACGRALDPDVSRCEACGWTFAGEEWVDYPNGPVPDSLLRDAYVSLESGRLGLKPEFVPGYLVWCEGQGLEVTGYELWSVAALGRVVVESDEHADAAGVLRAVSQIQKKGSGELYVSISVRRRETAQARGA